MCGNLETMILGNSVSSIGINAFFRYVGKPTEIISLNTTPPVCKSYFQGFSNKKDCVLKVRSEALNAYKSADYWKEFLNIVGGADPLDVKNISEETNSVVGKTFTINGMETSENYKGIVIKNGKKVLQK